MCLFFKFYITLFIKDVRIEIYVIFMPMMDPLIFWHFKLTIPPSQSEGLQRPATVSLSLHFQDDTLLL